MTDEDLDVLDRYQERRSPISILLLATLAVGASFGMLSFAGLATHLVGYVLGSFVCIALVGLFIRVDRIRRSATDVVYRALPIARYAWSFVLISGIAACIAHAWYIASELAARS